MSNFGLPSCDYVLLGLLLSSLISLVEGFRWDQNWPIIRLLMAHEVSVANFKEKRKRERVGARAACISPSTLIRTTLYIVFFAFRNCHIWRTMLNRICQLWIRLKTFFFFSFFLVGEAACHECEEILTMECLIFKSLACHKGE